MPRLHEAQRTIARELGFSKWEALKSHIESSEIEQAAIKSGQPPCLDCDTQTLHIRCGSDIKHKLAEGGFQGDFLHFIDVYVHGPVPQARTKEEFFAARAEYISGVGWTSYEDVRQRVELDDDNLRLAKNYARVMLWFEHDSHDILVLAKILSVFNDPRYRPENLQLVCVTEFPGVEIFNGIGQLPPQALRMLWHQFELITHKQLELGQQAWEGITAPDPKILQKLIDTQTPDILVFTPALRRHLQQLPSAHNGLNLTEELSLKIIKEKGTMNAARLFGWYTNHYEPLTFMGDSGYWNVLNDLEGANAPALRIDRKGENPKTWWIELTEIGEKLINNQAHWLKINQVHRWVGGIEIKPNRAAWCWNSALGRVEQELFK